jgi:hypothetical protein
MLQISISIAWAIILVLGAMSVVIIAGMSKLLWSGNAGWWRLRIHGFMLMLLWLVIPDGLPGLLFTLTFFASGLVEVAGYRAFRAPIPIGHGLMDLLDIDGGRSRVLYVDCSCHGTAPRINPLKGMGYVSYESVCRSSEQQDQLLDTVKRFGADKLIFSGCVIESLPVQYVDSLRFLGCKVQSLDLAHLSVVRTDGSLIDCELAMACLQNPWSEESVNKRCKEILSKSKYRTIYFGDELPFGLNLQTDEAWITNPSLSLIATIEELGIEMIRLSN